MKRVTKGKYAISWLDYVETGLHVAYRATHEPQELSIQLRLSKPKSFFEVGVGFRVSAINFGFAGDVDWDPARGSAKLLAIPKDPKKRSEEHSYKLEVVEMAPSFVRILAATRFGMGIDGTKVESMSIAGSEKVDRSKASVREEDVRRQLEDPDAYAGRFAKLAFPVVQTRVKEGLSVRLRMGAKTTKAAEKALQERLRIFDLLVSNYPPLEVDGGRAVATLNPAVLRSPTELAFRYATFDVRLVAGTDALLNMLHRFSGEVSPVSEVVLGGPW